MQQYPSIPGSAKSPIGKPCIAFYKYDGSNLRWEYSPKKGWNKFGTRTQLFDASSEPYNQAIPLFLNGMADEIVLRTKQIVKKIERITVFTEFFGPSSFAGNHELEESKELRLFDVYLYKKSFVKPKMFLDVYGDMPQAAQVVYKGNLSKQFISDVKQSKYPVFEGVISKGEDFVIKIKTDHYFDLLREKFKERWEEYGE